MFLPVLAHEFHWALESSWCLTGALSVSLSLSPQYYWLFVLSRGLVGIGESSYSSISPTIIGDLFTNNSRTTMLSIFYLAIPLGR